MKFNTLKFVATLLSSSALFANDYYEPKPFGDGKRAVVLEKLTTGKWWEKPAKNMHQKFIAERERSKAISFTFYAHDHGVLKLTVQCFPPPSQMSQKKLT